MVSDSALFAALDRTLEGGALPIPGRRYEGKVRDNYSLPDGRRVLVTTDRISAFDRVLGTLPFKGQVLNGLSTWWFERTADVAPNHLISVPDPQVVIAKDCTPLPVEMVVRAYLTGVTDTSIWTAYQRGERVFCGHVLPDGLRKNQPLPQAILTPSTKAEKGGHDRSASREEILASGVVSAAHFDRAGEIALALFARGQALASERGLILADTKYELGLDERGEVIVIDEIHTPDSSRYWFAASYAERVANGLEPESFDKEFVRRWLADQGFKGDGPIPVIPAEVRVEAARRYITAFETITGSVFVPNEEEPLARIARNLSAVLAA